MAEENIIRWLKSYQHPHIILNNIFYRYNREYHKDLINLFYKDKTAFLKSFNKENKERLLKYYEWKIRE